MIPAAMKARYIADLHKYPLFRATIKRVYLANMIERTKAAMGGHEEQEIKAELDRIETEEAA